MSQHHYTVVDLGTKTGSAIDVFRKAGAQYFGPEASRIPAPKCLGVDMQRKYMKDVQKRGYNFHAADVMSPDFRWPTADYYLAFDFLEHLSGPEASDAVLTKMLVHAIKGVWLRMPSFEQDDRGEGQLRRHGLRFAWSNWHGHPSHYQTGDACQIVARTLPADSYKIIMRANRPIKNSADRAVVPVDAPRDSVNYDAKTMAKKPLIRFDPAVIGQWELVVKRVGIRR